MAVSYKVSTPDELRNALNAVEYQGKTDDEIKAQAENQYKNQLNGALLAAQQTRDTTVAGLDMKKNSTNFQYDNQLEAQQQATRNSYASMDRANMARGMGRSSFNESTLNNINLGGAKALNNIEQNRNNALTDIEAQVATADANLAQAQNKANTEYQSSVAARIQALKDEEYNRKKAADETNNNLLFQLYNIMKGT